MAKRETPGPGAGTPSAPRVYDFLLGGNDNFAADRDLAGELLRRSPGARRLAQVHRGFVLGAVRRLAEQGVRQFLDLGCGLPRQPAVHDAARDGDLSASVIYVDRDPMVLSHVQALYRGPGIAAVQADIRDAGTLLAQVARLREGRRRIIDLCEPAAAVLGVTLSAMDARAAREAVAGIMAGLAPGSRAVISCTSYEDEAVAASLAEAYGPAGTWHSHSREDVESFFAGLEVDGQVTDAKGWSWPLLQEPVPGACVLGGTGRKP